MYELAIQVGKKKGRNRELCGFMKGLVPLYKQAVRQGYPIGTCQRNMLA
jgi:hypothetical protein